MLALTLDHLVWRFEHAADGAEIVNVTGGADAPVATRLSAAAAASRVRRLAAGMQLSLGVAQQSTVTVLAFNSREHFEVMLAVPLLGAVVNSINVRLSPEVLVEQAMSPRPAAVVVDAEMLVHGTLGATVSGVVGELSAAGVPVVVFGGKAAGSAGALDYEALLSETGECELPELDEQQTAYLFHSGGTTGKPKTYEVTHRAAVLHALSQATAEATGLTRHDRVLPLAPIFHVNGWGLPLVSAFTGSSLVFCGGDLSATRIAKILRDERVTVAAGVPTVWYDVCQAVERDPELLPRHLREIICGGSAVSQSIVDTAAEVLGAGVASAWGMTETLACSTYERGEPAGSVGRPVPLVEIAVEHRSPDPVEPGARRTSTGQRGQLRVRGPFVVGHGRQPGEWFDTGDIASIGPRGSLHVHDRERDLIKSGGEWIVSAELEQHLCTHAAVATVVAQPDPRWVERPVAYVVAKPGYSEEGLELELKAHVTQRFPGWWVPDRIVFRDSLPTTGVGKIDKAKVRDLASLPR